MLSKILAKNFQSWKNLEFDVTKGVRLIDGWNEDDQTSEGSGKSSILNAISWGAFGKLPKDAKVDEVIKDGTSSCEVSLVFTNGDQIVRTRKPNDLYIKMFSGQIVKGKDAKETQELIEEYIGMNFETFCQSVYFAQNYDKKFLPANQEEKGKILASIQNTSIFDKARKEVMELIKIENERLTSLKNNIQIEENNFKNIASQKALVMSFIQDKVKSHQTQVQSLTSKRDGYVPLIQFDQGKISDLERKISLIDISQITKDEEELIALRPKLANQLAEITYKKSQVDNIKKAILTKELEGKTLATKYQSLAKKKEQLSSLNENPTYMRFLSEKARISGVKESPSFVRLVSKKKDLEDYIKNPTKICPSCGCEMKNVDLSHTEKELSSLNREMDEMMTRSAQDLENINKEILNFEVQFKKDSETVDAEMSDTLNQLKVISEYLDQNKIPSLTELEISETQVKETLIGIDATLRDLQARKAGKVQLENELQLTIQKFNHNQDSYAQLNLELSKLKEPDLSQEYSKLSVLNEEGNQVSIKKGQYEILLGQTTQYLGRLETLKEGFKEIKSYVFNNALKELNYRANQYLSSLFEVEASIKFTNEDQKIEYFIKLDGQERGLGLLSGGQNRRFNLAVDLALSDLVSNRKSSKLNLLILDEYFKDLSESSMEKCLDLLRIRKSPVILIEHNSIFKNIVDNVFFVRLENGTSYESRS